MNLNSPLNLDLLLFYKFGVLSNIEKPISDKYCMFLPFIAWVGNPHDGYCHRIEVKS